MSEYRQRRTPGISRLFKFLLKTMQAVRNRRSAEERHKTEERESLRAGCCRREGWSRHTQQRESGHGVGVKWKFALPESNARSRTQGEGACFAGTKVLPSASLAWGHGEGATLYSCKGEADDTDPISKFETSTFFSC